MTYLLSKRSGMFGAAIMVILLMLSLIYMNVIQDGRTSPEAKSGVLDLAAWDARGGTLLRLGGEWEFYRGLLSYSAVPASVIPDIVTIPHRWNEREGSDAHTATYRIHIRNAPLYEPLALKLGSTSIAYRLYVNDRLLVANRDVERRTDSPIGLDTLPKSAVFQAPDRDFDLIVQVRSDGDSVDGLWFPVEMGSEDAVKRVDKRVVQKESILIGALLIMALYYLSFYLAFRKDRLYLIIAAGCALIILRIIVLGDRLLIQLLPEMSMAVLSFMTVTADVWAPLPFLLLIHGLFPGESKRWPIQVYAACAGGFSLISLMLPDRMLVGISNIMYIVVYGAISAGAVTIIKALLLKRPGAFPHLIGFIAITVFGIHDMLHFQSVIVTRLGELGSVGVTIFMITQAFVLAQRYAQSFEETKKLSAELGVLNRQKDEFLTSTSYELKTPLHGVIGIADSLQRGAAGQVSERQREQLELIAAGGRRLNHLIDDLLIYSQIKYGRLSPHPARISVEPMIRSILDVHRHLAGDRGMRFEAKLPKAVAAYADERMLSQILHNLVAAAAQIAGEGFVEVTVQQLSDEQVEVSVRGDSGSMTEEERQLAFASFEQIDRSLTTEYRGIKLGLPIARTLIELHGGRMELDEHPGAGVAFRFKIPEWNNELEHQSGGEQDAPPMSNGDLRTDEENTLEETGAAQTWPGVDPGHQKELVLIAADDRVYLQAIANALELEGYGVLSTTDGGNAWRLIDATGERLSLVICDMAIPDMTGFELCRMIRQRWTEVEMPVLMLSVDHRQETMLAAFEAGSNDFLHKPFDAAEFRARARMLLEIKSAMNKVKHAELAFLQAQIKPHFLYNTLNTISIFCVKDPAKARDLISDLSTYMRRSFEAARVEALVTVEVEMELVEAYLNMEQARFGSRLSITYRIDPYAEQLLIPQFTIQPLAENAVRHGVMQHSAGGVIAIEVTRAADGACRVCVRDDGAGLTQERLAEVFAGKWPTGRGRTGIGLRNIDERLRKLYGAGLRFRTEQGTSVEFDIPQTDHAVKQEGSDDQGHAAR